MEGVAKGGHSLGGAYPVSTDSSVYHHAGFQEGRPTMIMLAMGNFPIVSCSLFGVDSLVAWATLKQLPSLSPGNGADRGPSLSLGEETYFLGHEDQRRWACRAGDFEGCGEAATTILHPHKPWEKIPLEGISHSKSMGVMSELCLRRKILGGTS